MVQAGSLYEGETSDYGKHELIKNYLQTEGFSVDNHQWEDMGGVDRKQLVIDEINAGRGFVCFSGHGNVDRWACMNFEDDDVTDGLTNGAARWQLPIVFAASCFTGKLAPLPTLDTWQDKSGTHHDLNADIPVANPASIAPGCLQPGREVYSMGNAFLFDGDGTNGMGGAIAYLGERSAGRAWGVHLAEYFFKSYLPDKTIGKMWNDAVVQYYNTNNLSQSGSWIYDESKWEEGHMFDEPQKFILYGDPSVMPGGAFNEYRSGVMRNDWFSLDDGPFVTNYRYRIVGDVSVASGELLNALEGSSIFFESGRRITASGSSIFFAGGTQGSPVWFLSLGPEPQRARVVRGAKIAGQLRLTNGGQIKMH